MGAPRAETTAASPRTRCSAIDGGDDGLDVARACLAVVATHLAPGGAAILQLGTTGQVEALLAEPGLATGSGSSTEVRSFERG